MLTAKIISYSYDSPPNNISNINCDESHQISSVKEIIPLKYISEKTNLINSLKILTSNQSQSSARHKHLLDYIRVINAEFPGRPIVDTSIPKTVKYEKNQWDQFKMEELPNLNADFINLIVSHGKFIREEILPDAGKEDVTESETKNLYAFLVEYNINVHGDVTQRYIETNLNNLQTGINDSQEIPDMFFKGPITLLKTKLTSCDYKYKNNIKPIE